MPRFGFELDLDRPIFARLKGLDLGFALADQAQRDGLDAAGGTAAGELAPEHRRQRKADEIIECAAGEIGFDELAIDIAGPAERVEHRIPGHLVEDDPLDIKVPQRPACVEHLAYMP